MVFRGDLSACMEQQVAADTFCQSSRILILLSSSSLMSLLQSSGLSDINASALAHSLPAKMWYPHPAE